MHGSVGLLTSDHLASSPLCLAQVATCGSQKCVVVRNRAIQYSTYTRHGRTLIFFRLVFQILYKHGQVYYSAHPPTRIYPAFTPSKLALFSSLLYHISLASRHYPS
jgi:hypothetical protein